jgi:D-methionine transport system ATP-binding protein
MKDGVVVEEKNVYELFSTPVHPLSRELVEKSLGLSLPDRVSEKVRGVLVRLVHLGPQAEEAVLFETAKETGVHLNILHGRIEYIGGNPIGVLVVSLEGEEARVKQALERLCERVARVEVIRRG